MPTKKTPTVFSYTEVQSQKILAPLRGAIRKDGITKDQVLGWVTQAARCAIVQRDLFKRNPRPYAGNVKKDLQRIAAASRELADVLDALPQWTHSLLQGGLDNSYQDPTASPSSQRCLLRLRITLAQLHNVAVQTIPQSPLFPETGRRADHATSFFCESLCLIYYDATGQKPRRGTANPSKSGIVTKGPFHQFVEAAIWPTHLVDDFSKIEHWVRQSTKQFHALMKSTRPHPSEI